MKKAFTMIELIFVIVIIGILLTVAIPKLSATRDDAKVASIISTTKIIINNSKAFFTAKGESEWIDATLFNAINTYLYTDNTCTTLATNTTKVLPDGNNGTFYICNKRDSIVKLDFNKTHIKISSTNTNTSVSNGVKNSPSFKSIEIAHRLGGVAVKK